jgi:hypothetical protein
VHTAPLPAAEQKRFGSYVLISEIARGTYGRLWSACRRLDSGEVEAVLIRRLQKKAPLDAAALDGVRRAVELRTPVEGSHLVRMRGIEETEDELGIVFDYTDGKDLKSLLGIAPLKHLRAPAPVAIHIMASALESLTLLRREMPEEFATAAVWPDSIFVAANGEAHMLDPSISATLGRIPGPRKFPQLVGYSSPEEFGDDDDLGQADVFRAGVLLWEMLCAKRLFTGGTTNTTIEQVRHAPIGVIEDLPLQHAPLADVVKQALAQERGVRYGSADELLEALLGCGVPRATDAEVAQFMTELVGTGLAAQQRAVAIALERVAAEAPEENTEESPKLALATATPAPVTKTVISEAVPAPGRPARSQTLLGVPAPAILGAKAELPLPPPPPPPPPQRTRPPPPVGGVPLDLTPIDDLESPLPSNPRQVRTEHSGMALLDSLGTSDAEPVSAQLEALSEDDLLETAPEDDDLLEPVATVAATEPLAAFPSAPPAALGAELDSIAPAREPRFKRKHVMAVAGGIAVLLLSVGVLAVVGRGSPKEEEPVASAPVSATPPATPVETRSPPVETVANPAPSASAPPAATEDASVATSDEKDSGAALAALGEDKKTTASQSLVGKKTVAPKLAVGSTKTKQKTTAKTKPKAKTTAKSKTVKKPVKKKTTTSTKTTKKPVKSKKKKTTK